MSEAASLIVSDPDVMLGKAVIRGTRITVEHVLRCLAAGWSWDTIRGSYPHITDREIAACLLYAAERLSEERAPRLNA